MVPVYRKGDTEALEKVQKSHKDFAPIQKSEVQGPSQKLPTLYFRRIRRDMMETFKIVTKI